ncbi:MAG: ATP-binding cassette domain-containing protein, partial [Planctomycetia bacterium]
MIRCDRVIVERSGRMVIDRVSLSVAAGETLAVIGRSGAGKTTLLEAIATAVPVRGGDVVIDGHSVRRDPDAVRARIGYVPSHLTAWPHVRADEFLELFARAAGPAGHGLEAAVERALALAGLRGRGVTPVDRLPDGQAKLLLVGRALLHAPDVLVLDEPFGNLDPDQRLALEQLISDMQLGGRCVVAAIDDARVPDCFTHLAVLSEGRVVEQGPATFAAFAGGRERRWQARRPGRGKRCRHDRLHALRRATILRSRHRRGHRGARAGRHLRGGRPPPPGLDSPIARCPGLRRVPRLRFGLGWDIRRQGRRPGSEPADGGRPTASAPGGRHSRLGRMPSRRVKPSFAPGTADLGEAGDADVVFVAQPLEQETLVGGVVRLQRAGDPVGPLAGQAVIELLYPTQRLG